MEETTQAPPDPLGALEAALLGYAVKVLEEDNPSANDARVALDIFERVRDQRPVELVAPPHVEKMVRAVVVAVAREEKLARGEIVLEALNGQPLR